MPFVTFRQNNSGGSFDYDNDLTETVIVEGTDLDDILRRAGSLGIYFDGIDDGIDCDCCGDRWYRPWNDDLDEVPSIYGKPVEEYNFNRFRWSNEPCYVHYMNGIKEVWGIPGESGPVAEGEVVDSPKELG